MATLAQVIHVRENWEIPVLPKNTGLQSKTECGGKYPGKILACSWINLDSDTSEILPELPMAIEIVRGCPKTRMWIQLFETYQGQKNNWPIPWKTLVAEERNHDCVPHSITFLLSSWQCHLIHPAKSGRHSTKRERLHLHVVNVPRKSQYLLKLTKNGCSLT